MSYLVPDVAVIADVAAASVSLLRMKGHTFPSLVQSCGKTGAVLELQALVHGNATNTLSYHIELSAKT